MPFAAPPHHCLPGFLCLCYTSVGFNTIYGNRLFKRYYPQDFQCAEVIRSYRAQYGYLSPYEDVINTVSSA